MTQTNNANRAKARALEAYLVAAARLGDRQAMDQLVRLVSPRLLTHAARLLGESEQARDVVQTAWVDILKGLKGLKSDGAFLPWALQIVTRKVAALIKHRQKNRTLTADFTAEAETSTPNLGPQAADAASLHTALAQLSPDQRATVALFYLEDMRVAEVAAALDVPIGTVKTRLMHARAKLRHFLEGENHDQ